MYRLDGYCNLSEAIEQVWKIWGAETEAFPDGDHGQQSKEWRQETFIRWQTKMLFESENFTFLISSKGDVVKLDSSLVLSTSAVLTRINKALRKKGLSERLNIIDRILLREFKGQRGNLRYLEEETYFGWAFVDTLIGTVSLKSGRWPKRIWESSIFQQKREALRSFDGWSIALDKKSLDEQISSRLEPSEPTRGAGLQSAYDCYVAAYPNGKGNATWAQVEEKTGYSRRHINRALSEFGGQALSSLLGKTGQNDGHARK